jgi:gamma-glutamyltranspeptidase / glutathione hydrolase
MKQHQKRRKQSPVLKKLKTNSFLFIFFLTTLSLAAPYESKKFVVSSVSPYANETAKKIIASGGNLVDATVATTFTMGVVKPFFSSMGGGGFVVLNLKGKNYAMDFREIAPAALKPDYYKSKPAGASENGGAGVGVPGVVAGMWELHKKFGKKSWASLFTDAISLAEKGFVVSGEWNKYTSSEAKRFVGARDALLRDDKVPEPSYLLKQPKLAAALRLIQKNGPKVFYEGAIAKDIVETVKAAGGELNLQDLKSYKPEWRDPITVGYRDYQISIMPPPSSGAVVIGAALKMFEAKKIWDLKPGSSKELHLIAESLKRSFRGRFLLGDPKFAKNPVDELLGAKYLKTQADSISMDKAKTVSMTDVKELNESKETTHFSMMDDEGNAVGLTITLNGNYGSGVISQKYGIVLNNEMDDFTTKLGEPNQWGIVQGEANKVEAGKRPLSSMSPTIVTKDGKVVMVAGGQGGPRIISAVTQVIHRVLDNAMNIDQAIQFVRVHHQILPDKTFIDPFRSSEDTQQALTKMGHNVTEDPVARVHGVARSSKGWLESGCDSRGECSVGGL